MTDAAPHWLPAQLSTDKPAYLAIADAIADDIRQGRLRPEDRLPPQRQLAEAIGLNFSTISRAYTEAQRRGLIESRVGHGSFIRADASPRAPAARGNATIDMSMNLPPEPDDPALLAKMGAVFERIATDVRPLLRYQPFGGHDYDRDAAARWLARRGIRAPLERILVCAGTHSTLDALFAMLSPGTDGILCDPLTYTGVRAIAAVRGIALIPLAADADGITPESLDHACRAHRPAALYCNPTLQNPTTITQPAARRRAIIDVAERHGLPIIEDDIYGMLPPEPPPSYAELAPDRTYSIAGLSKTLGAGLRLAYLVLPDDRAATRATAVLRATTVMASPITTAIATDWIQSGVASELVTFLRAESQARQEIAASALVGAEVLAAPHGFHLWLTLPPGFSRVNFASNLRNSGIGIATSDAFCVGTTPPEAVRLCIGGIASRDQIRHAFEIVAATLSQAASMVSTIV